MMNRRDLMRNGLGLGFGVAGLTAGLPLWQAHAATQLSDLHLILCYFSGGWDQLLALDPRNPADFPAATRSDHGIQPAYDRVELANANVVNTSVPGMQLGPYASALADVANELCIVRGMSMETLTHAAGRRRFLTGKAPAGVTPRNSSVDAFFTDQSPGSAPIPNLGSRSESFNFDLSTAGSQLQINSVDDLIDVLSPGGDSISSERRELITDLFDELQSCPKRANNRVLSAANGYRKESHALLDEDLGSLFDFKADTAEMNALGDRYGFSNDMSSAAARAMMAVTAITAGVSRCVSIRINESGLDTHDADWETDHGPTLAGGFELIRAMIQDLRQRPYGTSGDSWLDHTLIVGYSEFTRTPLINERGGRDHSLTNSCVLAGGPMARGRVIGASSNIGMSPQAADPTTGLVSPGGVIIKPEHVWRTLFEELSLGDLGDYRVNPFPALLR